MTFAFLLGLGAMFLVQWVKDWIPWNLQPWYKSAMVLAVTLTVSILALKWSLFTFATAVGAAGIAIIAYKIHRLLTAYGDRTEMEAIALNSRVRAERRSPVRRQL